MWDSKIEATIRKLKLWDLRVGQNNKSLDNLCDFVTKEKRQIPASAAGAISVHLKTLKMQLREYFPVLSEQHSWIQNPFTPQIEDAIAGLSFREQDSFMELSCDTSLKRIFTRSTWHISGCMCNQNILICLTRHWCFWSLLLPPICVKLDFQHLWL